MKLKKLISLSLIAPTALVSPFIVSSCSEALPEGDTTKGEQTDLLESNESKILVLDSWLTSTYTAIYASTIKKDATLEIQAKIKNSLEYYLTNFAWPSSGDKYASETELTSGERETFINSLKEAYKFYISYMSTIQTSSNASPSTYFKIQKFEWIKNQYTTIVPVTNREGKILSISDINFGIGYTGCGPDGSIIEDDFKVLMATRGSLVYQNVLKMLLSEMYFLHSTENFVKNGTNFNSLTSKINTVNYINTMAYVGENNDFSTYLLKKYLVEFSPVFKWSYSSSDYSALLSDSSIVSTISQFNNIKTTKESTIADTLVINSNESQKNNISKIQAFDSLLFLGAKQDNNDGEGNEESTNSNEPKEGDLSINTEEIKTFGESKLGLWDPESKKTFSFTEIEAIKKAFETNKTGQSLSIPSIVIKEQSGWKTSHSIEFDDLAVSWTGDNSSTTVDGETQTFKYGNQELKINSISYLPDKSNEKSITIDFTYSFTATSKYSFNYSFNYSNWWNNESEEVNKFKNPYIFSGDPNSIGIKLFNDLSEPLGISYYMRILPLFKKESAIPIGSNAEWYMRGKFTFEGTKWNSIEQQKRLAYWFVLSDSSLYNKIQDFYLFNNFNIEGNISEMETIINDLGLTKKTDLDRENEGII